MDIIISNTDERPIYVQLYDQLKALLLSGAIAEGEMLPSIRTLSKELRISVITTKRAYDELEKDGYIYTAAGRGCFAAKQNPALIREKLLCEIETHLRRIAQPASCADIGYDDLASMLKLILQEDKEEKNT